MPDGDFGLSGQAGQAGGLQVDEGHGGAEVEGSHRRGRVLPTLGEDGKECRPRLARSGRGGAQDGLVSIVAGVGGGDLGGAQRVLCVVAGEVLHKGGFSIVYVLMRLLPGLWVHPDGISQISKDVRSNEGLEAAVFP